MSSTGNYRLALLANSALFLVTLACFQPCSGTKIPAPNVVTSSGPVEFPIDCRPYHMRSMKFLLKNFNKCSRELKANITSDKEYEENIGCAMKCTMRETEYDYVTEESMKVAIGKLLPPVLVEPVRQIMMNKCHEKYGDKLNPEDPKCLAYNEYAFCIQNCIADLVDNEYYCIKPEKKEKPATNNTS